MLLSLGTESENALSVQNAVLEDSSFEFATGNKFSPLLLFDAPVCKMEVGINELLMMAARRKTICECS